MKHPATAPHALFTLPLLALVLGLAGAADPAAACSGSKPPQPACGKTLAIAKSVPGVVLNAGATTFNVPTLVYFRMNDFPPGSGICPPGPHFVTLSLTATCTSPPHGSGSITAQITQGFDTVTVPVSVGAGPQRRCSVSGTATLPLGDGTTLTAAGDQNVCLVDPAPGNPAVPRLDMQSLQPSVALTHAGDQSRHTYRITNNDPTESFHGELEVQMAGSARLPAAAGVFPPGTGVYSVSDPGQGDNFPVGFSEDLEDGCLPLSKDPADPTPSTVEKAISLAPGESIDVPVFVRSWGMCADGSCGEGTVLAEGFFSDSTPGLACAGMGIGVSASEAPDRDWSDSGEIARALAGTDLDAILLQGEPVPGSPREVQIELQQLNLVGVESTPIGTVDGVGEERGRMHHQFEELRDPLEPIHLRLWHRIRETSLDALEAEVEFMHELAGAPTGFENVAPVGHGLIAIGEGGGAAPESHLEITYQVHVVGIGELGEHRDVVFPRIVIRAVPGGFEVLLEDGRVEPGESAVLRAVEVRQEMRGFFSEDPQALAELFTDGFESGDVARWSSTKP